MFIWQAIKMACKSLWTKKLRSFLTMLGIIIGVVTVALLTSVAQGVSDAVVSSIRSESTLAVLYNMSDKMTYSVASSVLTSQQGEESANDYFDFSLVVSGSSVVSVVGDLDGLSDVNDLGLIFDKIYTEEELEGMSDIMKASLLKKKKASAVSTAINLVDSNFAEVYDLEYEGKFPTAENEILVDSEFLETYFGNISVSDAIGTEISLGVTFYTEIVIDLSSVSNIETDADAVVSEIISYISNVQTDGGLGLEIAQNDDGSDAYFYDAQTRELSANVEFFTAYTNAEVQSAILGLDSLSELSEADIEINDIYVTDGAKTYTIVGVLTDDSDGEVSSTEAGAGSSELELAMSMMFSSSTFGECYVLISDENLAVSGLSTDVSDSVISYAYLRYKTEDYMDDSVSKITVAFISLGGGGFEYMTDFMIISFSSVASIISDVMSILTTMLTVISAVSLVVGGIGIMNIMLVSVTERTREIGIRKAIGAKRSSILVQFLIEALMLSLVGGAIGLAISWIGVTIIGGVMGFAMSFPGWDVGLSFGFCKAIGLIFGMYPAIKASRMVPIDALRHD